MSDIAGYLMGQVAGAFVIAPLCFILGIVSKKKDTAYLRQMRATSYVLRYERTRIVFWLGIALFFLNFAMTPFYMGATLGQGLFVVLLFGAFSLFCWMLLLHQLTWRLIVEQDHITVCSLFRQDKSFCFSDISKIELRKNPFYKWPDPSIEYVLYIGQYRILIKKAVKVTDAMIGYERFAIRLKRCQAVWDQSGP